VFAAQRERMLRSAGIGVVVLAAIIALAVGIGMAIARPIDKLARAATAIRGGAKRPLDPVRGSSEVTAVAGELVRLADEHERGSRERVALVNHYERILKSVRDIYLLTDESRRIVDFNDAAVEAYGYAPSELRGKNVTELRAADARESFTSSWDDVRKVGGSLFETVHQRRDGSRFAVEVSASSIEIAGVTYRQALVRDISARKATEDLLRQQNEELERFNRAAVGREMDVIELKRRINELARELGREPPFPLTFLDPRSDDPGAPS
jgi:PAS domain S-box-containing protein